MDVKKIVAELKKKYPGKDIIFDPPEDPTEIIVEIEPTKDHPERSLALAVVGSSKPHYHKKSTEVYEVTKGELTIYLDNKRHILREGEKMTIKPNVVHSVEGNETWFLTYSSPGWTFDDHIVV